LFYAKNTLLWSRGSAKSFALKNSMALAEKLRYIKVGLNNLHQENNENEQNGLL
jgi:hypothetical protein